MNFNNSKLTYFLSFVFVFELSSPSRIFKMKVCSCRRLVTESYSRDRGKPNGAIVTIFKLITIFLVLKSRKEDVIKAFLNSRMFLSGVFIVSLASIRACV